MTSWLNRLLRSRRGSNDKLETLKPIAPFETIEDKGPPFGKQLSRPLVYVFEHRVLPEAMFMNHPELMKALSSDPSSGRAFLHMWSKSAVVCESRGLWSQIEQKVDIGLAYYKYVGPLMDSVYCTPTISNQFTIWTIQTPEPMTPGETYFIALCRINGEDLVYGCQSPSARCFTLEATYPEGQACFCEWTSDCTHLNYGVVDTRTQEGFLKLVRSRLPSGA